MPAAEILELRGVAWPEIGPGDDLAAMLSSIEDLRDGDILIVTSKVVSKAEGRLLDADRGDAIASETRRVVARRGETVIAETRHGLVMAAAGVDASNTPAGTVLLLPIDPDRSARRLREGVYVATGLNVAVIVSDTAGRAWRVGQTDMAIGCAGLEPVTDLQGTHDTHGNQLLVTAPAVADELAAAADLVKGKASGCPVAVARGLAARVMASGEHGPGATRLLRPPSDDLFGLGVREAVAAAHRGDVAALSHFPQRTVLDPDPFDGLVESWLGRLSPADRGQVRVELARDRCPRLPGTPAWSLLVVVPEEADAGALVACGRLLERAEALAASHRLRLHDHAGATADPGWRLVAERCWLER